RGVGAAALFFVIRLQCVTHLARNPVMARPASNRPTDGELEILMVLWRINGGTIREVQAALQSTRPIGYTTVQKNLHIMLAKGLCDRTEIHGVSVYRARQ